MKRKILIKINCQKRKKKNKTIKRLKKKIKSRKNLKKKNKTIKRLNKKIKTRKNLKKRNKISLE
jgi:hypothetical protein